MLSLTAFASLAAFLALALTLAVAVFPSDTFAQGGPPPGGITYFGIATVNGEPVPDGHTIIGRVGNYESKPVAVFTTKDDRTGVETKGVYAALSVAAGTSFAGQTITFFLGDIQADETDIYQPGGIPVIKRDFLLTFPALPTPTPAPTAVPTETPVVPPTPTSPPTPPPSPTPEVAEPMVFISGLVFARGMSQAPAGSVLVARIGDSYQSEPAAAIATDGAYGGLVIDPGDPGFTGGEIKFFLNGVEARTTAVFTPASWRVTSTSSSRIIRRRFRLTRQSRPTRRYPRLRILRVPTQTPVPAPAPPTSTPDPDADAHTHADTSTDKHPSGVADERSPPASAPPTSEPPSAPTASPPEESGGCFSVEACRH